MSENETIRITTDDVAEANRLSLSCPICASAVEKNVENHALAPVICANCQTLYHRTCWEQNGGTCATLGCEHTECYPFGTELGPRLTITYSDLPKHGRKLKPSPNGRSKAIKAREKQRQREEARREFWPTLYRRILRAFGWKSDR
jgi:hypothetical protein